MLQGYLHETESRSGFDFIQSIISADYGFFPILFKNMPNDNWASTLCGMFSAREIHLANFTAGSSVGIETYSLWILPTLQGYGLYRGLCVPYRMFGDDNSGKCNLHIEEHFQGCNENELEILRVV